LKPFAFAAAWLCSLLLGSVNAHATDLLGLKNPALLAPDNGAYAFATALLASTYAPLKDAASEQWGNYSPRSGNNLDLVSVQAGAGGHWNGWTLGLLQRQEWLGQASKETLDVYRAQQLGLALPVGASYPLRYEVRGFEANAVTAGKSFALASGTHALQLGLALSLLEGTRVKNQTAGGRATVLTPSTLSVEGSTTNSDSRLDTVANAFVPRFRNGTATGTGYSVDLGLRLEGDSGLQFEWTVADAVSEMVWKSVPEMMLSGSSVFNGQFPDGHKIRVDFHESLPVKHALRLALPCAGGRLELADSKLADLDFPGVGFSTVTASGLQLGVDYDFFFQTVGLRLGTRNVSFTLRADSLNPEQAKALMLGFEIRL
jgi:hypothetical protein